MFILTSSSIIFYRIRLINVFDQIIVKNLNILEFILQLEKNNDLEYNIYFAVPDRTITF